MQNIHHTYVASHIDRLKIKLTTVALTDQFMMRIENDKKNKKQKNPGVKQAYGLT